MKLRPKIDSHDYETKKGHVVRFLKAGDKVKITIMFRGREQSRPELGFNLLKKLADDVAEDGFVESAPKQDGRNMLMVLSPDPQEDRGPRRGGGREGGSQAAERAANAEAERSASRPSSGRRPRGRTADRRRSGVRRTTWTPTSTCRVPDEEKVSGHHAEDEDALRCQEAVPRHRHRQGHAPPGRQDAPERAQVEHAAPVAWTATRSWPRATPRRPASCSAATRPADPTIRAHARRSSIQQHKE